jgi:catechol 2,3-dioxygenase-like lactoylglutathione lyase family enzyme
MMIFALPDGRAIALTALRSAAGPGPGAARGDITHFAFAVASDHDLNAWRRRLRDAQIQLREEDHGTQRSIYFADPSGVTFEITTPPSEAVAVNASAYDVVSRWMAHQP